jgi:hypothetical protein
MERVILIATEIWSNKMNGERVDTKSSEDGEELTVHVRDLREMLAFIWLSTETMNVERLWQAHRVMPQQRVEN